MEEKEKIRFRDFIKQKAIDYNLKPKPTKVFLAEYKPGVDKSGYIRLVSVWSLDVDSLLLNGCNWLRDYLKTNPNVSESDRHLCDGIGTQK